MFRVRNRLGIGLGSGLGELGLGKMGLGEMGLGEMGQNLNLGNDVTQQTQWTFAHANLLRTCYGETGVMDFGLKPTCSLLSCSCTSSVVINYSKCHPLLT